MSTYQTPQPFQDLFWDFTGHAHDNYPNDKRSIGQDLAQCLARQTQSKTQGPLVVANSVGIYVYSGEQGHPLISSADYRAAPNSGFYEMTSLSHVGPAIAYLGALQAQGDRVWIDHLDPLIKNLKAVKEVNAASGTDHWLTQLNCPVWVGREKIIASMFDYACSLAGNYLLSVQENQQSFSPEHVVKHFLEVNSEDYPIAFNTVMIATFALVGQKGLSNLYQALTHQDIQWKNAKVLIHNLAGTNYGAGMTAGSNWLYSALTAITSGQLDAKRILIVPYLSLPEDIGESQLSDKSFDLLASRVWGSIYARPVVTDLAFPQVPNIEVPYRKPIPGDYGYTRADQIDHFIQRLKFSTGNTKEMLSNTVGFWLAGEAKAKQWDFTKMDIPGITHGLPEGIETYPEHSPDIRL